MPLAECNDSSIGEGTIPYPEKLVISLVDRTVSEGLLGKTEAVFEGLFVIRIEISGLLEKTEALLGIAPVAEVENSDLLDSVDRTADREVSEGKVNE